MPYETGLAQSTLWPARKHRPQVGALGGPSVRPLPSLRPRPPLHPLLSLCPLRPLRQATADFVIPALQQTNEIRKTNENPVKITRIF